MAGSRQRIAAKLYGRGEGVQCFTRTVANEGHAAGAALWIYLQALVKRTQFSAGLASRTLIDEFKNHEIGFNVLSLIAMEKIGSAEVLQIGHQKPQQATRLKNTPALLHAWRHLITGDVVQEVRGVNQVCRGICYG